MAEGRPLGSESPGGGTGVTASESSRRIVGSNCHGMTSRTSPACRSKRRPSTTSEQETEGLACKDPIVTWSPSSYCSSRSSSSEWKASAAPWLGRDPDFVFPRPLPQIEENGRLGPILTKDLSEKGHGLTQNLLGEERQKKACALLFCFKPYKSPTPAPGAEDGGPFDLKEATP